VHALVMIALWNNSRIQIETRKRATPKEVLWFLKPPSSFITHGQAIRFPTGQTEKSSSRGNWASSSASLQGRERAGGCAIHFRVHGDQRRDRPGYRAARRDLSAVHARKGIRYVRHLRTRDRHGRGSLALTIRSYVNGKLCQEYPATDLVFPPSKIVAELARTMTLMPGDVIACGTSLGVEQIRPGDSVEVRIDGIGSLVNPVV